MKPLQELRNPQNRVFKVVRARKVYPFPGVWNYESESQEATERLHGVRIESVWTDCKDGMFTAVYDEKDWERVGKFIAKRMQEDLSYLPMIYEKQKVVGEAAVAFAKKIIVLDLSDSRGLSNLSKEKLLKLGEELKSVWIGYDHVNVPPWFIGGDYYQATVLDILLKKYSLSSSEVEGLITPPTPSFSHEEEVLLYEAALEAGDAKKVQKFAKKLSEKFYWIPFGYDGPQQNTPEVYEKKIAEISQKPVAEITAHLKDLQSLRERTIAAHSEIIKKHSIGTEDLNLIKQVYTLADMTDSRKEVTFQVHIGVALVLQALAKSMGFTEYTDLKYVSIEEISQLDKENLLRAIQERKSGMVHLTYKGETDIVVGKEADLLREKIFAQTQSASILKGRVGSRGKTSKVKGSVRVVMHPSEMDKVKQGDILVATMTTPEYVPAMRKAIAILTDEGGVTCHAAIVSRELGLPAIIAIGNATKVLKDGDVVEIDVDEGTVKIVK